MIRVKGLRIDSLTTEPQDCCTKQPGCSPTVVPERTMSTYDDQRQEADDTTYDEPYQDPDILRELFTERGLDRNEIADRLGCANCTIGVYLEKYGIERKYKDPEILHELYVEERLSGVEIAKRFGCADCTVSKHLREFGIRRKYEDPEWLREQYHGEGRSLTDIAEECGVSHQSVRAQMERHGIERRSMSEAQTSGEIQYLHDADWLRQEYIEKERTTVDIAAELGVTRWVVGRWVNRHGMKTRPSAAQPGPKNHNWVDGEYEQQYGSGFNEAKKEAVRERDNRECQGCGMAEAEHLERQGAKLSVHHKQKARHFDDPTQRNAMSNLVSLCEYGCHQLADRMAPLYPFAD